MFAVGFSGLIEARFFNRLNVHVSKIETSDSHVHFEFFKVTRTGNDENPKVLNKKRRRITVLQNGVVYKTHRYPSFARRIKAAFRPLVPSIGDSALKLYGVGEAAYHYLAYCRLNSLPRIRVPRIFNYSRLKKFGLVYEDQTTIEYIPGALGLEEYLAGHSADQISSDLVRTLREFMMLMVKEGILHIDFHAENILVAPTGKLYVIDWGSAFTLHDAPMAQYCSFCFGSLMYWLDKGATVPSELKEALQDAIIKVMGEDFDADVYHFQRSRGLVREDAMEFISNQIRRTPSPALVQRIERTAA